MSRHLGFNYTSASEHSGLRELSKQGLLAESRRTEGKSRIVPPAGLLPGVYPEALLASTHGVRAAQHEELVNAFVAVASMDAKTGFRLQELKSWLSFSGMTQSSPRVE